MCACSKENNVFHDANMSTRSTIDSEFSCVSLAKFSKIWQTGIGSKYVTILIVRARFSGISTKPVFTAVKDKFLRK